MMGAPFLKRIRVVPERVPTFEGFPYGLPFVRSLDLSFNTAVTYLVGENGSGKSTLVEAIAEACGFPVSGGGRNEAADHHGPEEHSALGGALRFSFARRPRDGYFFRAEWTNVAPTRTSGATRTLVTGDARFTRARTAKHSWRSC